MSGREWPWTRKRVRALPSEVLLLDALEKAEEEHDLLVAALRERLERREEVQKR